MSFDNDLDFIKALAQKMPKGTSFIVLYRPETEAAATDLAAFGIQTRPFIDGLKFLFDVLPVIMGARLLFCDNYYAFLGGLVQPKSMTIVQVWHANGAIKKFGWEDPTTATRSSNDQKRFQAVYDHFDSYIVASKAMGRVFQRSYHAPFEKMQLLGYPRSDQYLNKDWQSEARSRIFRAAPELRGRRVILYAPTYRPGMSFKLPSGLGAALSADPEAIVVVKLHPVLRDREIAMRRIGNPRIKFYHGLETSDLLTVTDTLVTDYSSVAFDFSLLPNAKSLIFFMFDLKIYQSNPGVQDDFLDWLPSQPVKTVQDLKQAIVANLPTDFTAFNKHWNTYNDGHASQRCVAHYLSQLKK